MIFLAELAFKSDRLLAEFKAGTSKLARIAMIEIVIRSSIKVNFFISSTSVTAQACKFECNLPKTV